MDISNGRLINNKYRGKKSHPVFENRILQQGVKAKVNSSSYQQLQQQQKKSVEIVKVREIKAAEPEMPEKRTRSFIFFLYLKKSFSKNVHSFNLISAQWARKF